MFNERDLNYFYHRRNFDLFGDVPVSSFDLADMLFTVTPGFSDSVQLRFSRKVYSDLFTVSNSQCFYEVLMCSHLERILDMFFNHLERSLVSDQEQYNDLKLHFSLIRQCPVFDGQKFYDRDYRFYFDIKSMAFNRSGFDFYDPTCKYMKFKFRMVFSGESALPFMACLIDVLDQVYSRLQLDYTWLSQISYPYKYVQSLYEKCVSGSVEHKYIDSIMEKNGGLK